MAPIVKLMQGGDVLNLNSGRYCIDEAAWMPPTTAREFTFGRASVGMDLASRRRANRAWSFTVVIDAASASEVERAIRDLQAFLNRAGQSKSEPLYVAYRAWNDYDFEPYFGQFGAFARYEVVNASADITQSHVNTAKYSNRAVGILVDVTIKPQAVGLPQRCGQASGKVSEDIFGSSDGNPKGTTIDGIGGSAGQIGNPYFMSATAYDNGWSVGGTGTLKSVNTDPRFYRTGTRSLKLSSIQTDNSATLYYSALTSLTTYTIHAVVKREDGAALDSTIGGYFSGTGSTSTYTPLGDGWYWCAFTFVADTTPASNIGIYWNSPVPLYVDILWSTLSTDRSASPFVSNYWGVSDVGTEQLRYKFADIFPARNQWTARVVWMPPPGGSGSRYFFEDSDNNIAFYMNGSRQMVAQSSSGNSVTSTALTITPGTPFVFHVTYDGSNLIVYNAGASLISGSSKAAASAAPSLVYVGSDNTPANYCHGTLMGVATFSEVMTAAEVLADYTEVIQQVSDNQRVDPLPYLWSKDGDDVLDNERASTTDYDFCHIAGLMGDDVDAEIYSKNSATYDSTHGLLFGINPLDPALYYADAFDGLTALGYFASLYVVSGTGTADTNAYNGAAERQSTNTTALEFCDSSEVVYSYPHVRGQEIWGWSVVKDAGSNLQLRLVVNMGSEKLYSEWRSVNSTSSEYRGFLVGPVTVPDNRRILDAEQKVGFAIEAKRSADGAANLDMSHAYYLTNCTYADASHLQAPSGADAMYIRGREVVAVLSSGSTTAGLGRVPMMPRPLNIQPNKINALIVQMGADGKAYNPDLTADFDKISITPRWDIY